MWRGLGVGGASKAQRTPPLLRLGQSQCLVRVIYLVPINNPGQTKGQGRLFWLGHTFRLGQVNRRGETPNTTSTPAAGPVVYQVPLKCLGPSFHLDLTFRLGLAHRRGPAPSA